MTRSCPVLLEFRLRLARMAVSAAALVVVATSAAPAWADAPITLTDAWSRPAIDTGVVYVRVANATDTADMLDSARTPAARSVELHRTMNVNDMSTMKPVYAMPVPAHATIAFAPGADHLMLIGLKNDLHANETFPIDLHLRRAGWITALVHVRAADSPATPFPEMAKAHDVEGVSQNSIVLDAAVFVLGFLILGGILVYIGKRIFTEKD